MLYVIVKRNSQGPVSLNQGGRGVEEGEAGRVPCWRARKGNLLLGLFYCGGFGVPSCHYSKSDLGGEEKGGKEWRRECGQWT